MKFFKSVIKTMKDTTWPTAKENRHDTGIVIGMSIFFVVFFAIIDSLVQWGISFL